MPQTEEGGVLLLSRSLLFSLSLSLALSLSLPLKQRRFVINRVILPKGVKRATYVVLTGQRSNMHETQGQASHTSNLAMCQHIDTVRQRRGEICLWHPL